MSVKKEILLQLGNFFRNCISLHRGDTLTDLYSEVTKKLSDEMLYLITNVHQNNGWFTEESVLKSLEGWAISLEENKIDNWLSQYQFPQTGTRQKVGVIMAGNIPLVGLHDALCVLISGNELYAKLSSKDNRLMLLVLKTIQSLSDTWGKHIHVVEQLKNIDVLIATGSDNSARYFNYYFKDKKRLIRKNRTSVSILNGKESEEDLIRLSHDVFTYYGLGCRNVTKIYLPEGYDLNRLFKAFFHYKDVVNHNKYGNNYDYNKAVYLLNNIPLIENGFLLLKEDTEIHSPVGVLFYEYYKDLEIVKENLKNREEAIQCTVSNVELGNAIPFGKAQSPELWDYADNEDTLRFLMQ